MKRGYRKGLWVYEFINGYEFIINIKLRTNKRLKI